MALSRAHPTPASGNSKRGAKNIKKSDSASVLYAALDLGTNSCRMLIAKPDGLNFVIVDAFSKKKVTIYFTPAGKSGPPGHISPPGSDHTTSKAKSAAKSAPPSKSTMPMPPPPKADSKPMPMPPPPKADSKLKPMPPSSKAAPKSKSPTRTSKP